VLGTDATYYVIVLLRRNNKLMFEKLLEEQLRKGRIVEITFDGTYFECVIYLILPYQGGKNLNLLDCLKETIALVDEIL
jgi:hypothetical protein